MFKLKRIYFLFFVVLFLMVHLPFAFAKSNEFKFTQPLVKQSISAPLSQVNTLSFAYDSLRLEVKGLSRQAFDYALKGYAILKSKGELTNPNVITIADFSKPSYQKRLFVIDIKNLKLLYNTYVAHGANSGKEMAVDFSNRPESLKSSPGFYITSGTYDGKHGYSMKLEGIEKGINDLAMDRAIVMHSADYVSDGYIRANGCLGRSWGCPAVSKELNKPIISKIRNGSCFFIYSNQPNYLKRSKILNAA
ncbi:MAG: murein L,D-transpeptidase catalytic domain family protein [Sphingobacteriales bacterium]|nr:murein L,D-transpeptidase catalytic domain family protein [Sphingobacteriales bacterium]